MVLDFVFVFVFEFLVCVVDEDKDFWLVICVMLVVVRMVSIE